MGKGETYLAREKTESEPNALDFVDRKPDRRKIPGAVDPKPSIVLFDYWDVVGQFDYITPRR
jgi:hypothetical protein